MLPPIARGILMSMILAAGMDFRAVGCADFYDKTVFSFISMPYCSLRTLINGDAILAFNGARIP